MSRPNFSPSQVCDALSRDRLRYYLAATSDEVKALDLYAANVRLSEAIYPSTQQLEVTLRNRFEMVLSDAFGQDWYAQNTFKSLLGPKGQGKLGEAVSELRQRRKSVTSGAVVAELSFGFWTTLFGVPYEQQLWRPYDTVLFPHATASQRNVKIIRNDLTQIRQLRNRIAHHEPVLKNPAELWGRYQAVLKLLGWTDPATLEWLEQTQLDRFPHVYKEIWPGAGGVR